MVDTVRFVVLGSPAGGNGTTQSTTPGDPNRAYSSVFEWNDNETTIGNGVVNVGDRHIVNIGAGQYTATIDTQNWVVNGELIFNAIAGSEHGGTSRFAGGTGVQIMSAGVSFRNRVGNTTFNDIEFGSSAAQAFTQSVAIAGAPVVFNRCLFTSTVAGSSNRIVNLNVANLTAELNSCLIIGRARGIDSRGAVSVLFRQSAIFSDQDRCALITSEFVSTNSWAAGATTADWNDQAPRATGSNNASGDASASVLFTSSLINRVVANEFTNPNADPALGNFTLLGTTTLGTAGTTTPVTTDIAGNTFASPPPIGPFAAPGGGTTQVFNDLDLRYNVTEFVSNDLDARYNITEFVLNDLDIRYSMNQFVSNDLDFRYSITEFVSNDLDLRYNITEFVLNDLDIRYSIASAFTQVFNDLDLRYNVTEFVSNDLDVRYSITEFVSNDLDIRYRTTQFVSNDLDVRYNITEFIGNNLDFRYTITEFVGNNLDIRYMIATGGTLPDFIDVGISSRTAVYSIASATPKYTIQ